jgi:hypothetical protein
MDKVIQKLVAMGIPGLVLLAVAATTGLAGGAALITALSVMGGPFGIMGGLAAIAALALTVDAVAEYGFEKIAREVVKGLEKKGNTKSQIRKKIDGYKLLSSSMKNKIKSVL